MLSKLRKLLGAKRTMKQTSIEVGAPENVNTDLPSRETSYIIFIPRV